MTLGLHQRGAGDPAMRFEVSGSCWRATRTPEGLGTELLEIVRPFEADADAAGGGSGAGAGIPGAGAGILGAGVPGELRVRAWGPGAAWLVATAPALVGLDDAPERLVPAHPVVAEAARRMRGLRIGRTGAVAEALIPAILEQKITGEEARHVYRGIIRRWGEDAPGGFGLRVLPAPAVLAAVPYHELHPIGLERRRSELLAAVCHEAPRLERMGVAAAGPSADPEARARFYAALRSFRGIGPWTAAEVGMRALGDPDAVSVGDFHIPSIVSWALAGEPRGTDERLLELLAPYAGQRGRVVRLLERTGVEPPKRGPRMSTRRIGHL